MIYLELNALLNISQQCL